MAGKAVFCPLHNWKINLENGCAASGGTGQVRTFPVKVIENNIYIAFEEGKFQSLEENREEIAVQKETAKDIEEEQNGKTLPLR